MYIKENPFFIEDPNSTKQRSKSLLPNFNPSTYPEQTRDAGQGQTTQGQGKDDLFRCIRTFLCFGRVIGIVPLTGLFHGSVESVKFRYLSVGSVTSLLLIIGMLVNEGITISAFFATPSRDASKTAENAGALVCYGIGLFVYIFMYRNSSKLIEHLRRWRSLQTHFYKEDVHLLRHVLLISGLIFFSAILENMTSHWRFFKPLVFAKSKPAPATGPAPFQPWNSSPTTTPKPSFEFSSVWEKYFVEGHPQILQIVPFNTALAVWIFICNKLAVYAWNFGDILVAILARGVYKRFQLHWEDFSEKIMRAENQSQFTWMQVVKDHDNLVDLVKEFNELLSPLIFACTATNIYFICLTLHSFLVPSDTNPVNNIYEAWAFIHLLVRTFTAILCCARINTHAHHLEQILAKCPVPVLTKEVERAELKLRTTCVGFGGLGCFTITNGFTLSVFSVIFTFEIVLLQSSASNNSVVQTNR